MKPIVIDGDIGLMLFPPAGPMSVQGPQSAGVMEGPAAEVIARVLELEPELSAMGFRFSAHSKPPAEYEKLFQQERGKMVDERGLAQFEAARPWLRQFAKTSKFYTRATSYGLKHIAEWEQERYITNGVFIAAAIAEGFRIKRENSRGSPNVFLNISPEVANWRERERRMAAKRV